MTEENLQTLMCSEHFKNAKAHYDKLMSGVLEEDRRLVIGGCILAYILDRPFVDQLPAAADINDLTNSAFRQCGVERVKFEAGVPLKPAKCEEHNHG